MSESLARNPLNVAQRINHSRVGSKDPDRIRWFRLIGGYALAAASVPILFTNPPVGVALGLGGTALAMRELLRGSRLGGSDGDYIWKYAQKELGKAVDAQFANRRGQ